MEENIKGGYRITSKYVFGKAVEAWGAEMQVDLAIEEMAELTKALIKFRRADPDDHMGSREAFLDVLEEIGDVEIMMGQLRVIYKDTYLIHNFKRRKIRKLRKMLNIKRGQRDQAEAV